MKFTKFKRYLLAALLFGSGLYYGVTPLTQLGVQQFHELATRSTEVE